MKTNKLKHFVLSAIGLSITSLTFASEVQELPIPSSQQIAQKNTAIIKKANDNYVLRNSDFENNLPKQAADWISYIKKNNPELNCPQSQGVVSCVFLSTIQLDDLNGEYQVSLKGSSFVSGFIEIPTLTKMDSQNKVWFKRITVNGKDVESIVKNNKTYIAVDKNDFEVKLVLSRDASKDLGNINFTESPLILINNIKNKEFIKDGSSIRIAKQINDVKPIDIENKDKKEELEISVFRKITTNIPNILSTKLKITYSGQNKDYFVGKVLPEGFDFNVANSSLRIEKKDDGFWAKLTPGEHEINIESFILKNIDTVNVKGLIPQAKSEIWSLEQINNIRQIDANASQQVDPKQALVPNQWANLPAFLVKDNFNYKTTHRGIEENNDVRVGVTRKSFYGFNDNKMFHLDTLNIENKGRQFLSKTNDDLLSESFSVNNVNQVLVNSENKTGVIIPKGNFVAQTQSTSEKTSFNAKAWEGDTTINYWGINLAPRMKMVAITGDNITSTGTWFDHWNLYSIFSVFIIVLAFFKLFGKTTATMAFIGLLMFPGEVFSWILWLTILLTLGLLKVLPESDDGKFSRIVKVVSSISFGVFVFYTIDFIKTEIQLIINPSLETISQKLHIINNQNFFTHLITLLLIWWVFGLFINKNQKETKVKKVKLSEVIMFTIISAFCLSLPSFLNTGRETVFGSASNESIDGMQIRNMKGIDNNTVMPNEAELDIAVPASPAQSSIAMMDSYRAKEYSKKEIENNIIIKKAQIGSGVPNWTFKGNSYQVKSKGEITNTDKVNLYIAPVWLVNIFSIVQISFLLSTLFLFGLGLINLSNKKDWFNKLPLAVRENKLVKVILLNDLQKGFAK
jgi:hypothetical protein